MGILDAPATDFRRKPLTTLDPRRDLPALIGWWDASELTGANGSAVSYLPDRSGLNNAMVQATTAQQPTVKTAGLNGLRTIALTAGQSLRSSTFASRWDQPTAYAQPFTMLAVAKASSTGPTAAQRVLVSSESGTGNVCSFGLNPQQLLAISATNGAYGAKGGRLLNDDTFHILGGIWGTTFGQTMIDGYITAIVTSQSQGTNTINTALNIGAASNAQGVPWVGELAELMVFSAALNLKQQYHAQAYLAAKWGVAA